MFTSRSGDEPSKVNFKPISEQLDVGTRIHWDDQSHNVYFVDVPNSIIYKYNIDDAKITKAKVSNEPLAFMFPVEGSDTKFIAGLGRKFVFVEWDGSSDKVSRIECIHELETDSDVSANRLNGAKVDPFGRLWAGTMGPNDEMGNTVPQKGSLYSVTRGVVKKHGEKIGISNGLAFDTNKKKMYYIDTLVPAVFQYDISDSGDISNRRQVFDFRKNDIPGLPDGLTIDKDGYLWVTAIFGGALVQFDPVNGKVLRIIEMPTPQITSVTFGEPKLNKLFVTTARIPVEGKVPGTPAGITYILDNIGSTGFEGDRYVP